MGGMMSLTAAARYPVAGVIAMSVPFIRFTEEQIAWGKKYARKRTPVPKREQIPMPNWEFVARLVIPRVQTLCSNILSTPSFEIPNGMNFSPKSPHLFVHDSIY